MLGIFNTIVPIGTIVNGTEGTLAAISAGDYRAAGKTGIQTLLIAVATAITLGEGAAALAGGKGAGTAAIANAENAALENSVNKSIVPKTGTAGGNRAGKSFTPKGRNEIDAANANRNGGINLCENCGVAVVPGQKSQKGATPPGNEKQRDHIFPKSKGGSGDPSNGQVLCRICNLNKSDSLP